VTRQSHQRRKNSQALALAVIAMALATPAAAQALEVIGRARSNNRVEVVAFRIDPGSAFISELRVRSGSLSMLLVAVEVEFADGGLARTLIGDALVPGQQSPPVAVDRKRAVRRIIVVKRPGLRDGETELQVLARPENPKR
jgi:hypothetical protein